MMANSRKVGVVEVEEFVKSQNNPLFKKKKKET